MKHLLNDLSDEEKNRIREQHSGGKKIVIENFNKLINKKLGDAKPYLNEEEEMKGTDCKEGDYYEGEKKVTAEYVKSKIIVDGERQIPFTGRACINNELKQAFCEKDKQGKISCKAAEGY
jgi:hypothetical protein